jgi:excinuclease ABC subunit C
VNVRAKARAEELDALAALAGLDEPPERIDCIDISHLGGTQTVASCIVFRHGEKSAGDYLKFKLQTAAGGDDPGAIREVVERRLKGGLEKGTLPDLLLVDGGAAQLAAAGEAVAAAGLEDKLPYASLVKEAGLHTKGETAERLWLPGEPVARPIEPGSAVLHLLQRIRDEAHRFAIEYQRQLRRKSRLKSGLEEIPGIGPKRRKASCRA